MKYFYVIVSYKTHRKKINQNWLSSAVIWSQGQKETLTASGHEDCLEGEGSMCLSY
jgi:hypothetical protein